MGKAFNAMVAAHPKTAVLIALGVGLGLVPLFKAIGWVF